VVGVAGCSKAEIKSPALWHLMGGGFGSGNLHGAVAHGSRDRKHVSGFGEYPRRVLMIDGVFMAFGQNYIQNGVGFDEKSPSDFHFYDLIASHQAHLDGFKVGVGDILITHESPGLREFTEDWKAGNDYFISKYGN
jgi:hypothetical protein